MHYSASLAPETRNTVEISESFLSVCMLYHLDDLSGLFPEKPSSFCVSGRVGFSDGEVQLFHLLTKPVIYRQFYRYLPSWLDSGTGKRVII